MSVGTILPRRSYFLHLEKIKQLRHLPWRSARLDEFAAIIIDFEALDQRLTEMLGGGMISPTTGLGQRRLKL